jgi:hypothetical protein
MKATRRHNTKNTKRAGGLLVTLAAVLLGVAALLSAPAGAQTTGQTSGGATALNGSTASGESNANNNSTASGNATADNGSTASGCSTALNNSTASGGLCLTAPTTPPTTATTTPPTTPTTTGGTTSTTAGVTTQTTAPRLALTGSHTNRLAQVALGALFLGLLLVALGLEGPARDPQA